jgi:hypothetical protein
MLAYNRCIGLMAPDIVGGGGGGTLLEGSHDSLYGGRDVISISTTGLHDEPDHYRRENKGELMLEAVEIVDEPLPRYRAAGIWVPHGLKGLSRLALISSLNIPMPCLANKVGLRCGGDIKA